MDSQCHYQACSSLLSLPFYWSTCLFFNYLEILDNSKIPVWTAKQNTWKASREIQQPAFWEVANQQLILRTGLQSVWEKLLLFVLSPQLHVTPTNLQPHGLLVKTQISETSWGHWAGPTGCTAPLDFSQPKNKLLKYCSPHPFKVHLTTVITHKWSKAVLQASWWEAGVGLQNPS